ncbi:hypothetical protein WJX72_010704 [[Myrmecia] bisecta]|uniref:Uncharacterized protein n=1 Tax=[Myrmecia] bisecta TaxID=41462 RepID=A0AAW1Q581_9CHLO
MEIVLAERRRASVPPQADHRQKAPSRGLCVSGMVHNLLQGSTGRQLGSHTSIRGTVPCPPAKVLHPPARPQVETRATMTAPLQAPSPSASSRPSTYPSEAARNSAFLEGVAQEQERFEVEVEGQVPRWLNGFYVRNGPGMFKGMTHLFDGYGMLVKFEFQDGHVYSSQRFVESKAWQYFKQHGKPGFGEFGTPLPPLRGIFTILKGMLGLGQGFTDNSSVSVRATHNGTELVAMTESVLGTYRVDPDTLRTRGQVVYKDNVKGDLTTAHPVTLPNGDLINLTSAFGGQYTVFRQAANSHVRQKIAEVPLSQSPTPSWIHTFPVTKNYAVVPEMPILFNLKAAAVGGGEYVMFDWKPELGTKWHVVPLDGDTTKIRTFTSPACFTFHIINAFESADGNNIIFDFADFHDPAFLNQLHLASMRSNSGQISIAPYTRCTIPLNGSEAKFETLMKDDTAYCMCELPNINPVYKLREYRYAYGLAGKRPTPYGNALAKFDVKLGETKLWHEPGAIPIEPYFVARPGAAEEDDGVVMCPVAGADGNTFLVVLDGQSFEEVARAKLPYGVPFGFHACYVDRN